MREQHIPTPPGRFALCPDCSHEPRHIVSHGRTQRETGTCTPTTRHALECRCGRRTARYATLQAAEAEWGPLLSQIPLTLPAPVVSLPRRSPRRTTNKEVRHG